MAGKPLSEIINELWREGLRRKSVKTKPCKSCGKLLIWAKSAKSGVSLPLDADPVEDGNVYLVDGLAHVKSGDLSEEFMQGPTYQSHFGRCPFLGRHRKAKDN